MIFESFVFGIFPRGSGCWLSEEEMPADSARVLRKRSESKILER